MSMNPVYLWNPQNFPHPQTMLPESLVAAQQLAETWAEQAMPAGADLSAFTELAKRIAQAAQSDTASEEFKQYYADIETWLPEYLQTHAFAELSEHYLDILPLLDAHSQSLGLVLYDSNGKLILPDGRTFPQLSAADEEDLEAFWRRREAEERQWRQENRALPTNIKDFYAYFRPKVDALMAQYGFEYAPQFYRPEGNPRKKSKKLEPDVMVYAKPTEHGWQTVYLSYRDLRKDGKYDELHADWSLSDEVIEKIYWYELDNIPPYDKKNQVKQFARGGALNIEYYLKGLWSQGSTKKYQTEADIEEFLGYLQQNLQEVAALYSYADVDHYFEKHMPHSEDDRFINTLTRGVGTWGLNIRLVAAYLNGHPDLAALADEWLNRKNYYFEDKAYVEELLQKAIHHLASRPL